MTVFFGAVELVLVSFGIRPALLTEDPMVGFAENVPQFVEDVRPDGTVILKTARNRRGLFNYQEFPRDKADNSYRIFCMGGPPPTAARTATRCRSAAGCAPI